MNEKFIEIIDDMADVLNVAQLKRLQEVLLKRLVKDEPEKKMISNQEYLNKFLEAKKIEGCSERTIKYYKVTVEQLLKKVLHSRSEKLISALLSRTNSPTLIPVE